MSTSPSSVFHHGSWNLNNLSIDLPHHLHNIITSTIIPHNSCEEDQPIRGLTSNACFSTGIMYNHLRNAESIDIIQRNFKLVWKAQAPNKIKTFLWLMIHYRLPTNSYLKHIGIPISPYCSYCQDLEEDINHIFF